MDHRVFIVIHYTLWFMLFCHGDNSIDEITPKSNVLSRFTYVRDAPVIYPALINVYAYAYKTTPRDTVYIARSSLPNAGLGAFAARPITRLTYFGPYGGYKHNNSVLEQESGYAWNVPDKSGNTMYYVDASQPYKSNWLRYINSPNTASQRNLIAFVNDGDIFYVALRNITIGEELLVYYGHSYAEKLGVDTTQFT